MADSEKEKQGGGAAEPSGAKGDTSEKSGPKPVHIKSNTPENRTGKINPSAPEDGNTTPNTTPTTIK